MENNKEKTIRPSIPLAIYELACIGAALNRVSVPEYISMAISQKYGNDREAFIKSNGASSVCGSKPLI